MKLHPRHTALPFALLLSVSLPPLAHAGTLTVTDITLSGDNGMSLTVPTIEAVDSNLDEATIRSLLSPDSAGSIARLATLDATKLRIPEIIISHEVQGIDGEAWPLVTTYRDIELSNVKDGVADIAAIAAIEMKGAPNGTVLSFGEMSTSALDLGALLGFYGLAASNAADEMRPVYKDFTLSGGSITGPLMNCTIAPASGDEFRARPVNGTLDDLARHLSDLQAAAAEGRSPSSASVVAVVNYYADLLTSFSSSSTDFGGFTCSAGDGVTVAAGPFQIGAIEPGIAPSVSFNDLRLQVANHGSVELANVTWKSADLNGPIDALRDAGKGLNSAWLEANWRRLIPAFDGFSISGFAIDMPGELDPTLPLVAGIDAIDLSLGGYSDGIPTRVAATGRGLRLTFPDGKMKSDYGSIGISGFDLDFDLTGQWDQAARTVRVERLGMSDNGLGGVSVSGTIANAGPELFSTDAGAANAALAGLTVTAVTLELDNAGIVPRLIAAAAAEQQTTPEALRQALSGLAQAMPLAVLGATPDATSLAGALGAFLDGAPHLSITLTSTDPNGIGLAELMAAEADPSVLKGKVRVTATASGEKQAFVYPDANAGEAGGNG